MMELIGSKCLLRPWRWNDEASLIMMADNRKIWRNLRDLFPHPYTKKEAAAWLTLCMRSTTHPTNLAVVVDGAAIGGVGINVLTDVTRRTAEIGYWLGEPWWGRGIATEALTLMTDYTFKNFDVVRLEAGVFAWNAASARVLEKAGFTLEARLRHRVYKDGELVDEILYAKLRPEPKGSAKQDE